MKSKCCLSYLKLGSRCSSIASLSFLLCRGFWMLSAESSSESLSPNITCKVKYYIFKTLILTMWRTTLSQFTFTSHKVDRTTFVILNTVLYGNVIIPDQTTLGHLGSIPGDSVWSTYKKLFLNSFSVNREFGGLWFVVWEVYQIIFLCKSQFSNQFNTTAQQTLTHGTFWNNYAKSSTEVFMK